MVEEIEFIINKCPVGLVIFNRKMEIIDRNKKASMFLNRFELPEEIITITKRIFDATERGKLSELFPGEIYITKKLDGSTSNWVFRLYIQEKLNPLVYLLIFEETVSNKLDMNGMRQQFKLTRRETDILRRVFDGSKNTEIAVELEISEQTVKDHLSNIYLKTGTENRMALMRTLVYSPNNQFGSQL
jgi:DNA-binding CsgD family transcriptional regulator